MARAEECGGWQEATASLLRKTRTEEKGKRKKKEGILQLEVGVPEREKARQSFSEELRYGHIGCFCFLISFISILFSLLLFLLCHCWSWMSIVEDWTLLSLSWLHLLCFCCYSLCFLSCLVFPEYEAVKGNESMGYYPADSPHPPWQRRSSNPPPSSSSSPTSTHHQHQFFSSLDYHLHFSPACNWSFTCMATSLSTFTSHYFFPTPNPPPAPLSKPPLVSPPSPPVTGGRWQRHCRRRAWRASPPDGQA